MATNQDKWAEFDVTTKDKWAAYETSPAPAAPAASAPTGQVDALAYMAQPEGWAPPDAQREAAKAAGVNLTTPTPKGVHPGMWWMSATDDAFHDKLAQQVADAFPGQGKPVGQNLRKRPDSDMLEYWNPNVNEGKGGWTAFRNGPGEIAMSASGPAAALAAPVIAAMAAPEVAGGMVANAGVQALFGAGAAGATDMIQKGVGQLAGIDNSNSDVAKSAAKAATFEGAATFAGGILPFVARGLRRTFKGPLPFLEEEAQALLAGSAKYDDAINKLREESGDDFGILAHQGVDVNNPVAQTAAGYLESVRNGPNPRLSREVEVFMGRQQDALRSAFSNNDLPPTSANVVPGQGYVKETADALAAKQQAAKDAYAKAEADARKQFANLPPSEIDAAVRTNQVVRQLAEELNAADDELKNKLYEEWKDMVGIGPKGSLSHHSVTFEAGEPYMDVIKKYGSDSITGKLYGVSYDEGTKTYKVDLQTLYETKIRINEDWATKTKGGEVTGVKNYDLGHYREGFSKFFRDTVETLEADGSVPPGSLFQLSKADAFYQASEKRWGTKFLEDFLAKRPNGEYVIANQDGLNTIFAKRDVNAARQLSDLVRGDPVARGEIGNYILALYNKEVAPLGLGSKKAHDAFMSSNGMGNVVEAFLGNDGKTALKSYEDVIAAVAAAKDASKMAIKMARTELGGRITHWSADQLVRAISNGTLRSGEADLIAKMSKQFGPDMLPEIQKGVADNIRLKLYPEGPTGKPNFEVLNSILKGGTGDLMKIMPQDYVRNLVTLREALPILNRGSENAAELATTSVPQKLMKQWIVPPMSREGNSLTGLGILRKSISPYAVWSALSDPTELAKLAKLSRVRLARTRAGSVAGAAAGAPVAMEDYRD